MVTHACAFVIAGYHVPLDVEVLPQDRASVVVIKPFVCRHIPSRAEVVKCAPAVCAHVSEREELVIDLFVFLLICWKHQSPLQHLAPSHAFRETNSLRKQQIVTRAFGANFFFEYRGYFRFSHRPERRHRLVDVDDRLVRDAVPARHEALDLVCRQDRVVNDEVGDLAREDLLDAEASLLRVQVLTHHQATSAFNDQRLRVTPFDLDFTELVFFDLRMP